MRDLPLVVLGLSHGIVQHLGSSRQVVLRLRTVQEIDALRNEGFPIPAVLVDLDSLPHSSEVDGELALIRSIRSVLPDANVICVSEDPPTKRVVEAIRAGASDFIGNSRVAEDLDAALRIFGAPFRSNQSYAEHAGRDERFGLHPEGPGLQELTDSTDPLLIYGEPATGKARLAKLIHGRSWQRHSPYLRVDCAAISGELGRRAMVGYERGAFVGAVKTHQGLLEAAGTGTIVFELVHLLDQSLQRLLAESVVRKSVTPVGGDAVPFQARVIATTHVVPEMNEPTGIVIPELSRIFAPNMVTTLPLRARPQELISLVTGFLKELGASPAGLLAPELCSAIKEYWWPGNLTELLQVVRTLSETRNTRRVVDILRRKMATRPRVAVAHV
jgi:DNA-binding NtrC family response regulator